MAIFVDFYLLPELLYRTQRLRGKDAIQRNWADFLIHNDHDEHYQALEVQSPSVARTTVHAWRLATLTGLLGQDGLTELGQRVVDRTADIEDALAVGVRDCMIGQDGIEIVPLLQRGASILARTNHVWARCCPGLLPDRDGSYRLLGLCRRTTLPETPGRTDSIARCCDASALGGHRIGVMSDAENMLSYMQEMVTNFYLSHRDLAEDTPMPPMEGHLP